jgi:glutaredoxin 3
LILSSSIENIIYLLLAINKNKIISFINNLNTSNIIEPIKEIFIRTNTLYKTPEVEIMNVKIYSSPTCSFCMAAKEFFKENKIKYTDFDVTTNEKYKQEAIKKAGQIGVPVIDIDGKIIFGFDKEKIEEIIKNAKK